MPHYLVLVQRTMLNQKESNMKLTVNRFHSDKEATLSTILLDGKFVCFGLEDEFREVKVSGETRIPAGTYNIGIRDVGGFHSRYSSRFKDIHKGMLEVLNVPNFKYILIHVGNTEKNTDGCLLVGKNATTVGTPTTPASGPAYRELYSLVIEEAIKGNLVIEYVDLDR